MKKIICTIGVVTLTMTAQAQGLTDMSRSKQAIMQNTPMGSVRWTGGFWGDRFNVLSTHGIWDMWETWNTPYETLDENGNLFKPESPNGYKYENLVLDMIHQCDSCLPFEVVREREFAPIKNKTGVDSVESAQALLEQNGVVL